MRKTMLAMLAMLALTLNATAQTPNPARQVLDACAQLSPNAAVPKCLTQRTQARFGYLKHFYCDVTWCVYKTYCNNAGDTCSGSGYKISIGSTDAGLRYTITDPKGAVTSYTRCGTCWTDFDYEKGMLKDALVLRGPNYFILTVLRGAVTG